MSGIAGILNLDGAPVDDRLLRKLTDFLAFRGPDARQIWVDGQTGFGHTLLKTTQESASEHQPFSLDGSTWIVADARVDGRRELIGKLRAHGPGDLSDAADVELILRAYQVWGEDCVERLLGDFCFAIWDASRRRLFCARDQMGVKPFFYAHLGSCLIFSNTLDCIHQHPAVSERINDLAIADFLVYDMSQDPGATAFVDIRRLPPAHVLTCESGNVSIRRYWSLPTATPVRYRREEECIEHFRELLDTAVDDRLRSDRAGVLMSGGLDSPTVAASAQRIFKSNGNSNGLRAYTQVFDSLIPHEERHYSGLVSEALGIPVEFIADDSLQLFGLADHPEGRLPEPAQCAWPDNTADHVRQLATRSRVALTGFGADPAFSCRITVHFRKLLKAGQFGRALADAARYLMTENRLSRLYVRTRWRILFGSKDQLSTYPMWLEEGLEKRLGLGDRWETFRHAAAPSGSARPEAHEAMIAPFWAGLFEGYDAGMTRVPVEIRHPFFDLRLVNFLLALPTLPWCSDKQLLRDAARGVLPDAVRLRRKSPLPADPLNALLQQPGADWVDRFEPVPELCHYVVRNRIPTVVAEKDSWKAWINLRPLSLNFWLRQRNHPAQADPAAATKGEHARV
jgi:asparagine synthase (glutamine-hydrolysing)